MELVSSCRSVNKRVFGPFDLLLLRVLAESGEDQDARCTETHEKCENDGKDLPAVALLKELHELTEFVLHDVPFLVLAMVDLESFPCPEEIIRCRANRRRENQNDPHEYDAIANDHFLNTQSLEYDENAGSLDHNVPFPCQLDLLT